ncbi:MAG: PAS domain-containing sensor histidine kinase [bacterium]
MKITKDKIYARSLLEAILDPLITISIEGKIMDLNEAKVRVTGVSRAKLIGTNFFDYFTEPQKAREVYQAVFADGSIADCPLTFRHVSGKLTDVLFNGSVFKDSNGVVLGAVVVARDITEQKLLQRERDQTISYTQGILGTMREPLLVLDKDLRIKTTNEAFCVVFSVTEEEIKGVLVYELKNRCWDTPRLREALEKILPQKLSFNDMEIAFDFPGMGSKIMLFNGRRLIQSEVGEEQILLAMQDITEQTLLQKRNDSFMSMASHELKTPITTIKTLVQILQKQQGNIDSKMLVEYLARMGQQVDQLTELVIDLLDVSRIKAEKFELDSKPFDFDSLIFELVKSSQFLTTKHKITIKGKTGAYVYGDRNAIGRVFTNIIVNAIKYAPDTDKIMVTISLVRADVCVSIQDFGIGISKDNMDKIFQRFFQVGSESGQSFSGLGIGLYISAAIMAEHDGRLWVESKEGEGSTFFFRLPVDSRI